MKISRPPRFQWPIWHGVPRPKPPIRCIGALRRQTFQPFWEPPGPVITRCSTARPGVHLWRPETRFRRPDHPIPTAERFALCRPTTAGDSSWHPIMSHHVPSCPASALLAPDQQASLGRASWHCARTAACQLAPDPTLLLDAHLADHGRGPAGDDFSISIGRRIASSGQDFVGCCVACFWLQFPRCGLNRLFRRGANTNARDGGGAQPDEPEEREWDGNSGEMQLIQTR